MVLKIPEKKLEVILKDEKLTEVSEEQLNEGDKVVMSVGTYFGIYSNNNDWRWIRGFVKNLIPSKRILPGREEKEEVDYRIIKISPFRNKYLRKLLPVFLTADLNQPPFAVCYGRILRYNT